MKIFSLFLRIFFLLFTLMVFSACGKYCDAEETSCDEKNDKQELTSLYLLSTNAPSAKIKIKAPTDQGNLSITMLTNKVIVPSGTLSGSFSLYPITGIYTIQSDTNGILYSNNNFNFGGDWFDGVLVKESFRIQVNRCYIIDGVEGRITETTVCTDF